MGTALDAACTAGIILPLCRASENERVIRNTTADRLASEPSKSPDEEGTDDPRPNVHSCRGAHRRIVRRPCAGRRLVRWDPVRGTDLRWAILPVLPALLLLSRLS